MEELQARMLITALITEGILSPANEALAIEKILEAAEQYISLWWHVEDVQSIRPDLDDKQAQAVLELASDKHDCDQGINWDVLKIWAEHLYPEPEDLEDQLQEARQKFLDLELSSDEPDRDILRVSVDNLDPLQEADDVES